MRILVVEDDRRMATLLRQGLVKDGHTVSVAVDGLEGLAFVGMDGDPVSGQRVLPRSVARRCSRRRLRRR
jgi:hypothetical protein